MRTLLLTVLLGWSACAAACAQRVELAQNPDSGYWHITVDGEPFFVKGAGGDRYLELLAESGGNAIRTWGADQLEPRVWEDGRTMSVMDRAHELGLKVCAGYWVEHPNNGFDYDDPEQVEQQLASVREFVNTWKDHPALLMWGVGNEVAGPDQARIFRELDAIAAEIKQLDPNHPTMTATAGIWPNLAALFAQNCPNIDILGVNAYAGLPAVPQELLRQGYDGPYLVTEYGPIGHWETALTPWQAEIEPSGESKLGTYRAFHHAAITDQPDRALGGFVFLWGDKQERTDTWYSMFLPTGEKTALVDAMTEIWSGEMVHSNHAPVVGRIESELFYRTVGPRTTFAATVNAHDSDGDALSYEWVVRRESSDKRHGGAFEAAPEDVDGSVIGQDSGGSVTIHTPDEPGAYRLHVYVRDGHGGGGSANIPFRVE